MRIGTWNLEGHWDVRRQHLMDEQDCDVWLLTEVSKKLSLPRYNQHPTKACMDPSKWWATILCRESLALIGLPDPHHASALVTIGGMQFCSSILPWRSCGGLPTWEGDRHAAKTQSAVTKLLEAIALQNAGIVWGGDWNHALSGREYAGSKDGRKHILNAICQLKLQVPTVALAHRLPGLLTIDHIAVPKSATVNSSERIIASKDERWLSDHDMYVVDVTL